MSRFIARHAGAFQLMFVIGIVGAAVMLSASLRPESGSAPRNAAPSRVAVSVTEPIPTTFSPRVKLNGVVEARTITSVIPQVAGRVVEVSPGFRPGARVAKGDLLFAIDPSDYELAIDRTLAEIEIARSDLARLEAEALAEREVWKSRFSDRPIPDLIARVPQISAAKARIHSGEAARRAAELSLERTIVRAAFDARILETRLDIDQVVSGNAAVGRMFPVASLEIAVPISADEARRIGSVEGRSALIRPQLDSGPAISGTVVRKAAALDERTRLGTLFVATDQNEKLTLGEFVSVEIEGETAATAYRLPPTSLTSRDQLWVVEGSVLAERRVEILGHEGDMMIVDVFDAANGVVAIPPSDVRPGLPVEPTFSGRFASAAGLSSAGE